MDHTDQFQILTRFLTSHPPGRQWKGQVKVDPGPAQWRILPFPFPNNNKQDYKHTLHSRYYMYQTNHRISQFASEKRTGEIAREILMVPFF